MSASDSVHRSPDATPGIPPVPPKPKVTFAPGSEHTEGAWTRPPSKSGNGAVHVRTFTGKFTPAGIEHMDKHINEWLEKHPEGEVKFSTLQVGEMAGSLGKEQMLVVQVWL